MFQTLVTNDPRNSQLLQDAPKYLQHESTPDLVQYREVVAPDKPGCHGCTEHNRLLDAFGEAVSQVLQIHEQQFLAIVAGDGESNRFDLLIHVANEEKLQAKYAYIRHVEAHGCTGEKMPLTKLEREVITDSMLKVQSIQSSLEQIDDSKIPEAEEIHDCLEAADQSFRDALKGQPPSAKR
jgi:hypothetical protein